MTADPSNGWDTIAHRFLTERSGIGADTVRAWCRALPTGASVLDLGCGSGVPITQALIDAGCLVHGIDASPTLIAAFTRRFPKVPVACEDVQTSGFFGQRFDGIVAVGLLFLLQPEAQRALIRKASAALRPEGRFLFTAPFQAGEWSDLMTGRQSVSLGDEVYRRALAECGLRVVGEYFDEGENHYYDAAAIIASHRTP